MTCMTTKESRLSLPGAYCHGNDMSATTSTSLLDTYQQDGVVDPAVHHTQSDNKLAIISPIFFSPSVTPGSLRTSLPGTWVDSSPYQLQQENNKNEYTHSNDTLHQLEQHHHHSYHRRQLLHQQQQPTSISSSVPTSSSSALITETPSTSSSPSLSSPVLDHVDMNHLRQTIASLRERAEQLEQTDLVVKKSIEVVAKKRLLAERRQYAQWDWCDQPGGGGGGCGGDKVESVRHNIGGVAESSTSRSSSVPVLDDMNETDHSDDDEEEDDDEQGDNHQHYDGCGGDWEWID
ncbi:hypothetical protein BCR42DRAFT_401633 [Absidia repens]|uniref:Uncharacterized protein n=1 Tax=Absidia repens TaxID=90262 RepID=A0A1X2J2N6_9FUNG|nr:hypothetical protein BCR42DRAFT_401633 [Absidia repens]